MQRFNSLLGLVCVLAISGCYFPEGTVSVTGGSGQSFYAESLIEGEGTAQETVVSATCSLHATNDPNAPIDGMFTWRDKTKGLHIIGSPLGFQYTLESEIPGVFIPAKVRYRMGKGPFSEGFALVGFADNDAFEVPGESKVDGDGNDRHAAIIFLADTLENTNPLDPVANIYAAIGFFDNGNFVYHGENGVIQR